MIDSTSTSADYYYSDPLNEIIARGLEDKLATSQFKLKTLENRLDELESLAKSKESKLQKQYRHLKKKSEALRTEYQGQKTMYQLSLEEIEKKSRLTRNRLQATLFENVNLMEKNRELSNKEETLIRENSNLKLSLKASRLQSRNESIAKTKDLPKVKPLIPSQAPARKSTTEVPQLKKSKVIFSKNEDNKAITHPDLRVSIVEVSKEMTANKAQGNEIKASAKINNNILEADAIIEELFFIF